MKNTKNLTYSEQLEHRLMMIMDDINAIKQFIYENDLGETFQKNTKFCEECFTHFNNIEIACDTSSEESLSWEKFTI